MRRAELVPDKEISLARYHFEVRTETHVLQTRGADLPDNDAARVEGAKLIGALLLDHAGEIWADEHWHMEVTNKDGLILYTIFLSAMKSAATS